MEKIPTQPKILAFNWVWMLSIFDLSYIILLCCLFLCSDFLLFPPLLAAPHSINTIWVIYTSLQVFIFSNFSMGIFDIKNWSDWFMTERLQEPRRCCLAKWQKRNSIYFFLHWWSSENCLNEENKILSLIKKNKILLTYFCM